jgi:hypothetical protein
MRRLRKATQTSFEFGHVPLHPTQNSGVGEGDVALGHHLDEISIAEPVRQVPAHTMKCPIDPQ